MVQITGMSEPVELAAGAAVEFTLETSEGTQRLSIQSKDISSILEFFVALALHLDDGRPITEGEFTPIPISGMGLQLGETLGTVILVVPVGAARLGFEIPHDQLLDTLQRFALLGAPSDVRPN